MHASPGHLPPAVLFPVAKDLSVILSRSHAFWGRLSSAVLLVRPSQE